jgi:cytidine deaminase
MANNQLVIDNNELVKAAATAREAAYAPYSKFTVGAALLTNAGRLFSGCNVENISLGLTICAERAAVCAAVTAGAKDIERIAIISDSREPAVPCGACRQVLAEFNPNMKIISATLEGRTQEYDLGDLLPKPKQGILEGQKNV